jgi:aspartyl-tRNA(Asn)/glutamyl-tRNA(Gln) amidotransferase subunit A
VEVFFHHNFRTLRNTAIGNFLDWCGMSIPNGQDRDGMPTGFMMCAPHGQDCAVLAAGLAIEPLVRG